MTINLPLDSLVQNKYTTLAAVAYAAGAWGCPIAATWWPAHKAQFDTTAEILKGAAVVAGFGAAGDAAKSKEAHEETKTLVADLQNQVNAVKQDTATIKKP